VSNERVIERVEDRLATLVSQPDETRTFVAFFRNSVEALEGIPYQFVLEARRLSSDLEMAHIKLQVGSGDGAFRDTTSKLSSWLSYLKHEYP